MIPYGDIVQLEVQPVANLAMNLIFSWLGQKPRLSGWTTRNFTPTSDLGPRRKDQRDAYERIVAHEVPGEPEPAGAFRQLAQSVLSYRVFPDNWVSPVLARSPIEIGDTVGILFHFLPGVDLFSPHESSIDSTGHAMGSGAPDSAIVRWQAIQNWAKRRLALKKTWPVAASR